MEARTNRNNLEELIKAVKGAKKEILISSGWITSPTLAQVFDKDVSSEIRQKGIIVKVMIRLGSEFDVTATDGGVFEKIRMIGAELRYHPMLHAKMFIVDDSWAMIGSFNLTGGGFGTENRPGVNPEAGVILTQKKEVQSVRETFMKIWDEETQSISDDLEAFVLDPSNYRECYIAVLKPLPVNHFVSIPVKEDDGKEAVIIGKISDAGAYASRYYSRPENITDFELRRMMFWTMGNNSSETNKIRAIAANPRVNEHLQIARIELLYRIHTSGTGKALQTGLNLLPPPVGAAVYKADNKLLTSIFNASGFGLARMIANPDVEVGLDPQVFTSTHMAVFGSTGSGKSYFVKSMLKDKLRQWCHKNRRRIIILDPHGEYTRALRGEDEGGRFKLADREYQILEEQQLKNLSSLRVRNLDDLLDACDLKLKDEQERNFIDKLLKEVISGKNPSPVLFLEKLKEKNSEAAEDAERKLLIQKTIPYIEDNFFEFFDVFDPLIDKLVEKDLNSSEGKKADLKYTFKLKYREQMFNNLTPELKKKLKQQVTEKILSGILDKKIMPAVRPVKDATLQAIEAAVESITFSDTGIEKMFREPIIYCINLSSFHDAAERYAVAAVILGELFNRSKESGGGDGNLILVEEAHNFAPEGEGRGSVSAKILRRIASEGRKFGTGLIVITQRPAYVSKDVLSQCNTQTVFRLINPNDLDAVSSTVEGLGEAELSQLPRFRQGEAIFTGLAIGEPVLVRVGA